jgi:hypothetical protein
MTVPEIGSHVQISSYSWEDGTTTYNAPAMTPAQRWHCAISQATEAARKRFPHSNERIERAYALVHEGKVVLHPKDKTATVQSSDGTKAYTVNGHCDCPDAPRAPENFCKHALAVAILKKATVLVKALSQAKEPVVVQAEAMDVEAVEAVEAVTAIPDIPQVTISVRHLDMSAWPSGGTPEHANPVLEAEVIPLSPRIPAEFLYERDGTTAIRWGGLLHLAHQAGLCSMTVEVVTVSAELAVMRATATFNDGGVWTDIADATPGNVGKRMAHAFVRMASTRAMARALRLALDIPFVASCELEGD